MRGWARRAHQQLPTTKNKSSWPNLTGSLLGSGSSRTGSLLPALCWYLKPERTTLRGLFYGDVLYLWSTARSRRRLTRTSAVADRGQGARTCCKDVGNWWNNCVWRVSYKSYKVREIFCARLVQVTSTVNCVVTSSAFILPLFTTRTSVTNVIKIM